MTLDAKEQVDAWRREAEYWQKRLERSDDQAAGLLTACLTVGVVGAGAAGYVEARTPDWTGWVITGLVLVIVAGLASLGSRTLLAVLLARASDGDRSRPSHEGPEGATTLGDLCWRERSNAQTRKKIARRREWIVGGALLLFAAGTILIAAGGLTALGHDPVSGRDVAAGSPDRER